MFRAQLDPTDWLCPDLGTKPFRGVPRWVFSSTTLWSQGKERVLRLYLVGETRFVWCCVLVGSLWNTPSIPTLSVHFAVNEKNHVIEAVSTGSTPGPFNDERYALKSGHISISLCVLIQRSVEVYHCTKTSQSAKNCQCHCESRGHGRIYPR